MSNDFQIGSSNYEKRSGQFGNKRYFYIKPNEPNIYRVLPPVLSLARTGEYFKYHAIHRNMRATDGKQRGFVCPEDVDYKTKLVKQRCPVCDKRREFEAQYQTVKDSFGQVPSADQKQKLNEFWMAFIEPLKVERQHYMNVVNQAGEIGILPIPTTLKNDMQASFKKMKEEEGVDPSGVRGIFVNFSKVSQYKGDPKPAYKVEPLYETVMNNGMPMKTYKFHEIVPEFVNKMKTDCRDLNGLHRVLNVEELAGLASADRETRKRLLDSLFSMPEDTEEEGGSQPSSHIPGVAGASTVARMDIGPNGAVFNQPVINQPAPAPAAFAPQQLAPAPAPAPVITPAPAPVQTQAPAPAAPAAAKAGSTTMSDQDFLKLFQNMGGANKG